MLRGGQQRLDATTNQAGSVAEMKVGVDDELIRLRAENARLISMLECRDIAWREPELVSSTPPIGPLTTDAKVALFRRLFRGRTDVFPVRWESKSGKSGYSPACVNEWRPGKAAGP